MRAEVLQKTGKLFLLWNVLRLNRGERDLFWDTDKGWLFRRALDYIYPSDAHVWREVLKYWHKPDETILKK